MTTADYEYLIIGAGPAGLQFGFFLRKSGHKYLILERGARAGHFFETYPRHRMLISINKVYTGYSEPETNLRWDWNSLLSDYDDAMTFKHFNRDYFPQADDLVRYLNTYAGHFALSIRFNSQVTRVAKEDGHFRVTTTDGNEVTARIVVVATGLFTPNIPRIPGIELAENYGDMSLNPEDYLGQRVLILGKGNSALETANHLLGTTALMHLASRHPLKLAWRTHFVGHTRSVNMTMLDSYRLKGQNALIDAELTKIERRDDDKLIATFVYGHADGEVEEIEYDRVLLCTGFRFDHSIFDDSCRPALAINDRLPDQTSEWESTNVPDLYFAGTLTQMRDYKKKQSSFIHGFRYNVELLHRILEQKYHGRKLTYKTLARDPQVLTDHIIFRCNYNSSLWQQTGFLCDLLVVPDDGGATRYYENLSMDYVRDHFSDRDQYYTVTMEFGQERIDSLPDVFNVPRPHKADADNAHLSAAIHPIVRSYSKGKLMHVHHVMEDFASEFHEPVHTEPLLKFFTMELSGQRSMTEDHDKPNMMEMAYGSEPAMNLKRKTLMSEEAT